MTKRKPPAGTGINPKLLAIAAKLDEATAHVRKMLEADDGSLTADRAREKVFIKISNLEETLAEVAATNMEELVLKSRYVGEPNWDSMQSPVAASIVRDLLALSRKPKAAAPKEVRQTA